MRELNQTEQTICDFLVAHPTANLSELWEAFPSIFPATLNEIVSFLEFNGNIRRGWMRKEE